MNVKISRAVRLARHTSSARFNYSAEANERSLGRNGGPAREALKKALTEQSVFFIAAMSCTSVWSEPVVDGRMLLT